MPKGEQCLYCPNRYIDIRNHVNKFHVAEKNVPNQVCKKCGEGSSTFASFETLLKHTRRYHRKGVTDVDEDDREGDIDMADVSSKKHASKKKKVSRRNKIKKKTKIEDSADSNIRASKLCSEGAKQTPAGNADTMNEESMDGFGCSSTGKRKKYIPQHLAGICPFCGLKFSDLLGHIRHQKDTKHQTADDQRKQCSLCQEDFNSVRELVTHRQLHPQFKNHVCTKCGSEFETVVLLRNHRANSCSKTKKKKKKKALNHPQEIHRPEPTSKNPVDIKVESNYISGSNTDTEQTSVAEAPFAKPRGFSTLLMMVDDLNNKTASIREEPKDKPIEYEGRGTVKCYICLKSFTLKSLLRRHYIRQHSYEPSKVPIDNVSAAISSTTSAGAEESCIECQQLFGNIHGRIKVIYTLLKDKLI